MDLSKRFFFSFISSFYYRELNRSRGILGTIEFLFSTARVSRRLARYNEHKRVTEEDEEDEDTRREGARERDRSEEESGGSMKLA